MALHEEKEPAPSTPGVWRMLGLPYCCGRPTMIECYTDSEVAFRCPTCQAVGGADSFTLAAAATASRVILRGLPACCGAPVEIDYWRHPTEHYPFVRCPRCGHAASLTAFEAP